MIVVMLRAPRPDATGPILHPLALPLSLPRASSVTGPTQRAANGWGGRVAVRGILGAGGEMIMKKFAELALPIFLPLVAPALHNRTPRPSPRGDDPR